MIEKPIDCFGTWNNKWNTVKKNCKECECDKAKRNHNLRKKAYALNDMAKEKICRRCKILLPTTNFYKACYTPDGYGIYCKSCRRNEMHERTLKEREVKIKIKVDSPKEELWADIVNYEGKYQVSNLGRVKGLCRLKGVVANRLHVERWGREQLLSIRIKKKSKYAMVMLCKNGKSKTFLVHRIVATAFIPNPDPIIAHQVNHKNGIRHDNRVENLEWVSPKGNTEDMLRRAAEKSKNNLHEMYSNFLSLREQPS